MLLTTHFYKTVFNNTLFNSH